MEGVVHRLSDYVANQIAAGEVVTAPSSVVKELMENSIDAGATYVIVNFKGGGSELIQIVDDGVGMSFDDALLCFERHATSKIADINDIYKLDTYGFRGEALASIAAVAEVELTTKREKDSLGTKVEINGGLLKEHCQVSAQHGTQMVIKNLFYNIPARRNFLKSERKESAAIVAEFERVALCYPKITFCLYNDGNTVYNLPASNLRTRVAGIVGKQNNAALMELYIENAVVEIRGYVGKPDSAKKSSPQFMFINGRYFQKSYFRKAIQLSYEKLLPPNKRFLPPFVLYFNIDPSRIDVNVSPSKTEVKFDDEHSIFQILELAVKESLSKNGIVPMIDFDAGSPIDIPIFDGDEGDIKAPSLDINPYFNPFDETFSFSMAVDGQETSFRSSIDSSYGSSTTSTSVDELMKGFESASHDELLDIDSSLLSSAKSDEDFKEIEIGEEYVEEQSADIQEEESSSYRQLILSEEAVEDGSVAFSGGDEHFVEIESLDIEGDELLEVETKELFIDIDPDIDSVVNETSSGESLDKDVEIEIEQYEDLKVEDEQFHDIELGEDITNVERERVTLYNCYRHSEKYLVASSSCGLHLIHIARASWRVIYDRLSETLTHTALAKQKILFPIDVELTAQGHSIALSMSAEFGELGFEYESVGGNVILLSAIPSDSGEADPQLLFEELIDSVIEGEADDYVKKRKERFLERISYIASSAQKSITDSECNFIAESVLNSPLGAYAPNGKKILATLTTLEIDNLLK